jgi:Holliday junction resolvase
MRRAAKRDASEPEIVSTLIQCGFSVYRLNQPVDLLVGHRGKNFLVEVKTGRKGYGKSLNENQHEFNEGWRGSKVVMLHSAQDAMDWAVMVSSGEKA